ncbi:MAG TPA: multidrug efflux SMR transporter [Steroidobacteraceae bacterium]|jgi:quaternary ammonium compound-resistance protein SugE|nr:multidrug efflux SMR transporter [Steroidobacteraceae bacterium]
MSPAAAWTLLVISGLLDVAWALSMKQAQGYTRLGWSVLSLVLLGLFVYLLGLTLRVLPVGTAYAVWTGIGAVGSVALGIVLFDEPVTAVRIGSIALVVTGIIGLKLSA